MNTDTHLKSSINPLPEAAREVAQRTTDAAKDVKATVEDLAKDTCHTLSSKVEQGVERTKDYAQHAVDATKDIYQSTAIKAEMTLENSKDYVRRNPVPVVLGAIAFGAALGYLLVMSRRKPTFSERYAQEPMGAVREALLGALAPVTQRVHEGYDSARNGAGKAIERVQRFGTGHSCDSFSDQLGRIGNNLKFW